MRDQLLSYEEYRNKVRGCFTGKNIGGTLGAPFECVRGVFDVSFYTQELGGKPMPNDDLDLQLVWLNAVERFGRKVNASILGEYWLSYITPSWGEYGAGKNNLRVGLQPPFSGVVSNDNRNSCGAFIRSEIWACLAPGHPEVAVAYAYEDAAVDHAEEGLFAELFTAAVESSAFVETDIHMLLDIGLSYIPEECAISRVVRLVRECYEKEMDWKEVRRQVLIQFPSHFGMMIGYQDRESEPDIPDGEIGYDAPANIGLTILGLLYGEGDFGKSICLAASCGEDGDCTAATVGAMLGIRMGAAELPEKWTAPIGDNIVTLCINRGDYDCRIPKTVTELTERVCRLTPSFLGSELVEFAATQHAYRIRTNQTPQLFRQKTVLWGLQPFRSHHQFPLVDISIDLQQPPRVTPCHEWEVVIELNNCFSSQQWIRVKWFLEEGFSVSPQEDMLHSLEQHRSHIGRATLRYVLKAPEIPTLPRYELVLGFYFNGRHTKYFVPITLLASS